MREVEWLKRREVGREREVLILEKERLEKTREEKKRKEKVIERKT